MKRIACALSLSLAAAGAPCLAYAADAPTAQGKAGADSATGYAARLAAADKLIAIMHMDKQLDAIMPQMLSVMMKSLVRGNTGQEDRIRQILTEELGTAFANERPAMMSNYRETYAKNLSLSEMEAMTSFYGTDIGQSVLSKMPKLTQDAIQGGVSIGQKAAMNAIPRVIQRMQAAKLDVPKGI